MRALVTAFEAFGGARANASSAAVTRLPVRIGALDIVTAQLPASYARSGAALIREIEHVKPTFVLCVGEAGERHELNVERIAINVQDARLADNDGAQPIDVPVLKDAPVAYFATLPVRAIHDALIAAHLPATVSNSAGTFVCNHVMYGVLHFLNSPSPLGEGRGKTRAGFIHVPYSEDQVLDKPAIAGMSVATMVKGIEAAIAAAVTHETDLKLEGGALD